MDLNRSLAVEPDKELEFRRPFTALVKQTLTVKNANSDAPLVFKVKTTAPKMYCVRPNSGKVAPNQSVEVQVLLQAMREDPPPDFKCKDKFLVQAIKVSNDILSLDGDEYTARVADLWNQAEQLKKSGSDVIAEHKLRVSYLPADPNAATTSAPPTNSILANPSTPTVTEPAQTADRTIPRQPSVKFKNQEFSNADENLPPYTSRNSLASTSQAAPQSATPSTTTSSSAAPQPAPAPAAPQTPNPPITSRAPTTTQPKPQTPTPSHDTEHLHQKIRTLEAACEGYKTEIERLKLLRQRRGDSSDGGKDHGSSVTKSGGGSPTTASSVVGHHAGQTLPLPFVAVIAFVAFILGAVFF
ncbi:phosphatidylinositol-binding protein scs2 [Rhizophlyctis rosea]|nr:phosphatidylinositol-binding protein scs2 [Rhizophlyctis rosea]